MQFELSVPELEIDDISRYNPQRPKNADFINRETEFSWNIETQQGIISFKSVGYKQYVRQPPLYLHTQAIGQVERGGISFEKVAIKI